MGGNRGTENRSLDGKMMDTGPAAFAIVLKGLPDFLFFQAVLQNLGISMVISQMKSPITMMKSNRETEEQNTALTNEISSLKTLVNQRDKENGNLKTEMQALGRLKEQYTAKNEEAGRYKRQKKAARAESFLALFGKDRKVI
jgi:regulator of replication initiation timing